LRKTLTVDDRRRALRLFGPRDSYLKAIRDAFGVKIVARNGQLTIEGPEESVRCCEDVILQLQERLERDRPVNENVVKELIERRQASTVAAPGEKGGPLLEGFRAGRLTRPRSSGQACYLRAMLEHEMVFCIGPAGTGKTYLAVAVALYFLRRERLHRIILSRPAVEAGEHLGFLPGDMRAKVNPYLRPLYDALHDLLDVSQVTKYIENDIIEILPLAFIRGRTLEDAFIILDEAQNCTADQMKAFLTRLGVNSRLVVTGDITQVDLPQGARSGLVDVKSKLGKIPGIVFVSLGIEDIVRHPLVSHIVAAYERHAGEDLEETGDEEDETDSG